MTPITRGGEYGFRNTHPERGETPMESTNTRRQSYRTKAQLALFTVVAATTAFTGTANAQNINIAPDSNSLPGNGIISGLLNGLAQFGLYAAGAAIVVGGGMWGYANWQERPGAVNRGQKVAIGGILGAVVIGAANVIINTAFAAGAAG